ncbi:MAG: hypothetical protein RIT14_220 [Pseudomonadota bacterium]|jgi:fimbrial chaperone protein
MTAFARRLVPYLSACGAALLLATGSVAAATLSVSPTSITVAAPQQTGLLTLRAGGPDMTVGQIRVMAMDKRGDQEILSPTKDVIASPPAMRLQPDQEITVRLVRRTSRAIKGGRECYRVLVDQLPQKKPGSGTVGFVIRQSIPLCFLSGT